MTYKEKQKVLGGYAYHQRRILSLEDELLRWHTIATNITTKLQPVVAHTNDNTSKIERCAIKCAEIEQTIMGELVEAEAERRYVQDIIATVKDMRRREVLEMRYIHNIPVHQIAIRLDKCEDNVYKMLRTTIKNLDM